MTKKKDRTTANEKIKQGILLLNNLDKDIDIPNIYITPRFYIRIATFFNVKDMLNEINNSKSDFYELPNGFIINARSLRYKTFARSLECSRCNLKGMFLGLERPLNHGVPIKSKEGFHLNLYAIDEYGREILMTKDHTIPTSKGGENSLNNLTTMCYICNSKKGNTLIEEEIE